MNKDKENEKIGKASKHYTGEDLLKEYEKLNAKIADSEFYNKAVAFAMKKHSHQFRKATAWPYAVHLYEVAQLLQESGCDNETVIAGVLHDTVEDTDTSLEEIKILFGKKIASIVDVLSENKSYPYNERKAIQAERIKRASREAKMVKCADCLSNLKSIYFDLKRGAKVWWRFNGSPKDIQKHYGATIDAISELYDEKIYQELKKYYNEVFDEKEFEDDDFYSFS